LNKYKKRIFKIQTSNIFLHSDTRLVCFLLFLYLFYFSVVTILRKNALAENKKGLIEKASNLTGLVRSWMGI